MAAHADPTACRLIRRSFDAGEWRDVVSAYDDLSLPQTWAYGEAKAAMAGWQVERVIIEAESQIGAAQVLVRPLPGLGCGLAWINRGPLTSRPGADARVALTAALKALRAYWVDERRTYLRVAPAIEYHDDEGTPLWPSGWSIVPGARGWASALIDLSATEAVLRAGLRKNWRNQLGRAERDGVTACGSTSPAALERFLNAYVALVETKASRTSVTPNLFRALAAALPERRKLWVFESNRVGEPLGALLAAEWGAGSICLAVALTDRGRTLCGGNLLYWEAILQMRRLGCRWFDVGGADPDQTPAGILHFKQGLCGRPYRLCPELEAHDGSWLSRAVRWRIASSASR